MHWPAFWKKFCGPSLATLILAYLVSRAVFERTGFDFRIFWVAGRLWANGISPYDASFLNEYVRWFGAGPNTHFWVYPPYWLPIVVPLSYLPFEAADKLWAFLNIALLIAATWLTARAMQLSFALALLVALPMQATFVAVALGQTSLIVLFGFALALRGTQKRDGSAAIIGALIFTALKPNIGLFLFIYFIAERRYREVAVAGAFLLLLALPSLATAGPSDWLGFLNALQAYSAPRYAVSQPPDLTGIVQLISLLVPTYDGSLICLAGMALAAAVLGLVRHEFSSQMRLAGLVAAICLLVPLHSYDTTLCMIPLTLLAAIGHRIVVFISMALLFRPTILAQITQVANPNTNHFIDSLIVSLTLSVIAISWLIAAHRSMNSPIRTQ